MKRMIAVGVSSALSFAGLAVYGASASAPNWLTVTLAAPSEAANEFLASPNGASGPLAPRAITPADLPQANNSNPGAVRCDGTTTNCSGGVVSVIGGGAVASVSAANSGVVVSPATGSVNIGANFPVQATKTAAYTVVAADAWTKIPIACTGYCTVTLPQSTAAVFPPGTPLVIENTGTAGNNVGVASAAGTTLTFYGAPTNGSGPLVLSAYQSVRLTADRANNYLAEMQAGPIPGIGTENGTAYTFSSSDCWQTSHFTSASPITATVPSGLPIGCNLAIVQDGAGRVTVASAGPTLLSVDKCTGSAGQYAVLGVHIESATRAQFFGRCS